MVMIASSTLKKSKNTRAFNNTNTNSVEVRTVNQSPWRMRTPLSPVFPAPRNCETMGVRAMDTPPNNMNAGHNTLPAIATPARSTLL